MNFYHRTSRGSDFKGPQHRRNDNRRNVNEIEGKDKKPVKCFNCGKMGHIAKDCRKPKKHGPKKGDLTNTESNKLNMITRDPTSQITINIKKSNPQVKTPEYKTLGAAGADLYPSKSV